MATPEQPAEPMLGFGPKQAWLAVRDGDPELTMAVLGLRDLGPVTWRTGLDLAYLRDDRVVLTPLLPGADGTRWLLVVGLWLLKSTVDISELSELLGTEVQSFATHRVTEWHRWQRARDGAVVRSFEYAGDDGEVLDWRGEPDTTEREIGLPATFDPDPDPDADDPDDPGPGGDLAIDADDEDIDGSTIIVGEDDLFRVAAAWSVDPLSLEGQPAPGPLNAAAAP